jgi:hypothetical protein
VVNNSITVSSFDSPEYLWELLNNGHTLVFREYENSDIPPDHFYLNDLDLVCRWDEYSRSIAGLQSALLSNATRLIDWKFKAWFGKNSNVGSSISDTYSRLVSFYSHQMNIYLSNYFSAIRIIEAGSCYTRFLIDELTLLSMINYDHIFDWEAQQAKRSTCFNSANFEIVPKSITHPEKDILARGDNFIIERRQSSFSGSCTRETVVILDSDRLPSPTLIAEWLSRGYILHYAGKNIFSPEDDGSVFGTDSYGQDFYAGHISYPEGILSTVGNESFAERLQNGAV